MDSLVIDCTTGEQRVQPVTPEERASREAAGQAAAQRRQAADARLAARDAALARVRTRARQEPELADLLQALGLEEAG